MKTNPSSRFQALWAGIVLLCLSAAPLCADTFGDFTYTDDGTSITITDYPTTNTGDVVIPDTIIGKPVTSIGQSAFRDCSALTSVTIPAGVTSIGSHAFYNCSALISVTIPEGVTSIGSHAFYNCNSLTSVTIPEGVTSIGDYAFYNCSALTSVTIPVSVTSIGGQAFYNCSALISVTIPEGVTSIGDYAFQNCNSLTSVTISEGVTSIGYGAFRECSSLTTVTIPTGVTRIENRTFLGCSSLTSVTIPESVTTIRTSAFEGCSALTSVTIPEGVTTIRTSAFEGCSALTEAVFLGDAPSLASLVFSNTAAGFIIHYLSGSTTGFTTPTWLGYPALPLAEQFGLFSYIMVGPTTIEITDYPEDAVGPAEIPAMIDGKSVTSIGSYAFRDCSALTSVTIPEGVTSIGDYAFCNCNSLTSVTIPDGVTSIGRYAFESCWALKSASLPSTLTEIEESTFQYCWQLPSIVIPAGVTRIGEFSFHGCSSLASVTISSSVSRISNQAFPFCESLTRVSFIGDMPTMGALVFYGASPSFTVYYFDGATGFTSPFWLGFPSVNMGAPTSFSPWLLTYGFPIDADLQSDPNGDGVSLLMAYALNLNPNLNLAGSLPAPVLDGATLSMSFHAASPGITYRVEASIDLNTWVTEGVTMSGPDNQRTASVAMDLPQRFLRLVVQQ